MPIIEIVFYLFSAILVASALSVVTVGNPVYAVLFLVLSFFSAACIWLLLEAEFLAIVLVLVYVGAVMVLFLFVVMMLDVGSDKKVQIARYLPVGLLVALAMAAQLFLVIWTSGFEQQAMPAPYPEGFSHTQALGELLYTKYLYAFEIAAVLLLVAIIAAISLTHRRRPNTRYQDPAKQITVTKSERVRLVSMPSEGMETNRNGQEGS